MSAVSGATGPGDDLVLINEARMNRGQVCWSGVLELLDRTPLFELPTRMFGCLVSEGRAV